MPSFPTLPFQGVESSSDVALYSGLAAGVVTVVLLIIAVTLYRRSQSEYGVDVIDSSALTGGFQSFSFKTSRQGEPVTVENLISRQNCTQNGDRTTLEQRSDKLTFKKQFVRS